MDSDPANKVAARTSPNRGNLTEVLVALAHAYEEFDADALVRFYAEDGEWLDTLGHRARGRTQIQVQVRQLFECGWIPGDALFPQAVINVKMLDPTLALAWISTPPAPADKARATSAAAPKRRMHRMQVLRQNEGRWRVLTEVVMDDTSVALGKPAASTVRDSKMHEEPVKSEVN